MEFFDRKFVRTFVRIFVMFFKCVEWRSWYLSGGFGVLPERVCSMYGTVGDVFFFFLALAESPCKSGRIQLMIQTFDPDLESDFQLFGVF